MGTVYKAHDPALDRPVALKVLPSAAWSNEDAVSRFRKEAQLAASLHHPHIVQIYTLGEYQGVHFYCMEFVKGKTLALLLRESGPLPLSRALQLMSEACDALIAAHAKNVVHRDLKPGNIMLDEAGRVRILDFGLAKEADVPGYASGGAIVGTPAYMSPEQCRGGVVDARTDLYSLGVVLYELLAGRLPFSAETRTGLMRKIQEEPPIPLSRLSPHLPREIIETVERMIAKRPDDRYQSARELLHDLQRCQARGGLSATLVKPDEVALPSRLSFQGRYKAVLLVILLFTMAVGGMTWLAGHYSSIPLSDEAQAKEAWVSAALKRSAAQQKSIAEEAIGVLQFDNTKADSHFEWIGGVITNELNADLSRVPKLKVYARDIIDFYRAKGHSPIEIAEKLGVLKMLRGSYWIVGQKIRIDATIIDTKTMLQEASVYVEGRWTSEEDIPGFIQELSVKVIAVLDPRQAEKEKARGAAPRNTDLDAYKLLLEAEGEMSKGQSSAQEGEPSPPSLPDTQGYLLLWPDPPSDLVAFSWAFTPSEAAAQGGPNGDEWKKAILETLWNYKRGYETQNIDLLAQVYANFPSVQREAHLKYFQNVRDLKMSLSGVDILREGDEAIVSYTRTDDFVDAKSGKDVHLEVRLTKILIKDGDNWKISDKKRQ
jgi:TolB-like protein